MPYVYTYAAKYSKIFENFGVWTLPFAIDVKEGVRSSEK